MSKNSKIEDIGQDLGGNVVKQKHNSAELDQRHLFERKEGVHNRSQRSRNMIHWAELAVFWVSVIVVISFIVVWAWYILMPESRYFVSEARLDTIDAVLLSVVGSSFLTGYGKSWLRKYSD